MDQKKAMWRSPWRYRESLIMVAGLIAGGYALQLQVGPFNHFLLHRPVNFFLALGLLGLAALSLTARRTRLVGWLSSVYLAVALMTALLIFSLIMGLTPQMSRLPNNISLFLRLGFTQVTSSWPFVLVYFLTLISLIMVVAWRLRPLKKNGVFILNHLGLWLVLAAAGLGAADRERHVMYVQEGQVEWRVYSDDQRVLELPLAIRLDDFDMEEYPPKLAIIDRLSGRPLPLSRPEFYQIDPQRPQARLLDWDLTLESYLPEAVPAGEGQFVASPMPASTQAAQVLTHNRVTKDLRQGWVTAGNRFLPVSPLVLDEGTVLVMTQPEPKRFTSKIKVFSQTGQERETTLEVNHPLRVGPWLIYQYGYDNQAGRMSSYSSFELVRDDWLYPAYAGMILWALGALGLIIQGRKRGRS